MKVEREGKKNPLNISGKEYDQSADKQKTDWKKTMACR